MARSCAAEFDEPRIDRWLSVWNAANAHERSFETLTTATALRYGELARSPLLLSLLAIHHTAKSATYERGLSASSLYAELLDAFIARRFSANDIDLADTDPRFGICQDH